MKSREVQVFKAGSSTFALDVASVSAIKTDKAFGSYLLGEAPVDLQQRLLFDRRLNTLRRRGMFLENPKDIHQAYQSPVYELSIEVFHGCNLRCTYCYTEAIEKRRTENRVATFESLRKTIDYFVEDFGRDAKAYEVNVVGGGEPLLRFDLIKQLKSYCKEVERRIGKRIIFWIFTNGTVFNEEIIDYLIAERQGITISLDGPEDVHNALRPFPNGRGSHGLITQWIQYIQKKTRGLGGLENLWVSTVVTARHKSVKDVLLHLRDLGIRNAQIRPIKTSTQGLSLTESDVENLKLQYEEMVDLLIEDALSGDGKLIRIVLNDRDFWGRHVSRLITRQRMNYRCGAGKSRLSVMANGDIYPCDISSGISDMKLNGDNGCVSVEKQQQYYDQDVTQKPSCKNCWARYFCGGGCYVSAFVHHGRIDRPDGVKCSLIKHLIRQAIRFIGEVSSKDQKAFQRVIRYVSAHRKVLSRVYDLETSSNKR